AGAAWSKLKTFETSYRERFGYVDYLAALGKSDEAWKVFSKDGIPQERIFNSSFETEPLNDGFDWRFASTEHSEARRDTTVAKSGMASWLVTFDGKDNPDYGALSHWAPVR